MWHIAVQQKERKQLFLFNYFTPGIPKEPRYLRNRLDQLDDQGFFRLPTLANLLG